MLGRGPGVSKALSSKGMVGDGGGSFGSQEEGRELVLEEVWFGVISPRDGVDSSQRRKISMGVLLVDSSSGSCKEALPSKRSLMGSPSHEWRSSKCLLTTSQILTESIVADRELACWYISWVWAGHVSRSSWSLELNSFRSRPNSCDQRVNWRVRC